MNAMIILVPFALILGLLFVGVFVWAVKNGQFDDLDTPAQRMLFEDQKYIKNNDNKEENHE
ncbi:MAG: cbb3-type cytochrome oxidase assembly protein CcoS [Bdellovibrio sp. CG12_big_fil_rev_8_21_14_0_65_39_13]|nr:MAG: cbb3-type cytochrome oxidase assembly protein CcoS [Bdellovibrio sp. CG12_big_fil_rev_8_21_14_0_65_39_13]